MKNDYYWHWIEYNLHNRNVQFKTKTISILYRTIYHTRLLQKNDESKNTKWNSSYAETINHTRSGWKNIRTWANDFVQKAAIASNIFVVISFPSNFPFILWEVNSDAIYWPNWGHKLGGLNISPIYHINWLFFPGNFDNRVDLFQFAVFIQ